jgi:hypothetical protein
MVASFLFAGQTPEERIRKDMKTQLMFMLLDILLFVTYGLIYLRNLFNRMFRRKTR